VRAVFYLPVAVAAFVLTSCNTVPVNSASFAVTAPIVHSKVLVDDSLAELVRLYPPAISRITFPTNPPKGGFGDGLRVAMRQAGYAVVEAGAGDKADTAALPLRYVVDQPIDNSYRVTLRVGSQSFSRIYGVDEKGIFPSAGWALDLTGASPELIDRANRPPAPPPPPSGPVDGTPQPSAQPAFQNVPAPAGTGWHVSLTGFRSEATARHYWAATIKVRRSWGAYAPHFVQAGPTFGIQFGQFQSSASARAKCKGIRAARCGVVRAG